MYRFLENPENFLHSINLKNGQFEFIEVDRNTLSSLPFLDHRYLGKDSGDLKSLPVMGVFQNLGRSKTLPKKSSLNFIFHSAFCCSTMLSNCLDIKGKNLSLKEPMAFLGLAQYQQTRQKSGTMDPNWWAIFNLALFLLARPFQENEKILIKPSNVANNLAAEVLESPVTGKVLLLYSPLERFLISVLSGGGERMETLNKLFSEIIRDHQDQLPLKFHEIGFLPPLKKMALMWGLQVRQFSELARSNPGGLVKTLNCEVFLDDPKDTLDKLFKFFEIEIPANEIEAIVKGQVFKTDSKIKEASFSRKAWDLRKQEIKKAEKTKIDEALRFAEDLGFPIEGNLPENLL